MLHNKLWKLLFHKKKSENDRYICVLHFPKICAWITPESYPVKKYVVAYNGKYDGSSCKCRDEKDQIIITIGDDALSLEFPTHKGTYTEELPYVMNEVCTYYCPVNDVLESWAIIVSSEPIQHERFMPGYEEGYNGVYYNVDQLWKVKRQIGQKKSRNEK